MLELIEQWLSQFGLDASWANLAARATFIGVILVLSLFADFIARHIVLRTLSRMIRYTRWRWDDALLQRNVLKRIGHFAPAVVIYLLAPLALQGYEGASRFITQLVLIYMIVLGLLVLDAVLNVTVDVYRSLERSRYMPIRSFVQVIKLIYCSWQDTVVPAERFGRTHRCTHAGLQGCHSWLRRWYPTHRKPHGGPRRLD